MDILFVGAKDRGVRCLKALLENEKKVVGVVTVDSDDPDKFWTGSVSEVASDRGLPVLTPDDINDASVVADLEALAPDLVVMSGYNQVLGEDVLNIPPHGVINLHAGRLPEYRGGSPLNWSIINGETEGTATIHYATERIDAGGILAEERFPIPPTDTIADVREKTLDIFPPLLVEVVDQIESGDQSVREQDLSDGAYWGSRIPRDGRIHWDRMTAHDVHNLVRALTHPYPGAFTIYRGKRLYVWDTELLDDTVKHHPGRIVMRRGNGRVVAAKDEGLLVKEVQPEGGSNQSAAAFLERGEYLA